MRKGWVHDLQNKSFAGWCGEDCTTMAALQAAKERARRATRTCMENLTEEQLNATLLERPAGWAGELRSPAFILPHVIFTHFTTKAKLSRCCEFWDTEHPIRICSPYRFFSMEIARRCVGSSAIKICSENCQKCPPHNRRYVSEVRL